MKKIFIRAKWVWAAALCAGLAACAFTEDGNRVNDEHQALEKLEHKRQDYEERLVIVLNNLERYPGDERMTTERNQVQKKLKLLAIQIDQQRQMYTSSVDEWEQKISDDLVQQQMIDKEQKADSSKQDGQWSNSP